MLCVLQSHHFPDTPPVTRWLYGASLNGIHLPSESQLSGASGCSVNSSMRKMNGGCHHGKLAIRPQKTWLKEVERTDIAVPARAFEQQTLDERCGVVCVSVPRTRLRCLRLIAAPSLPLSFIHPLAMRLCFLAVGKKNHPSRKVRRLLCR
jgi:hypothetical protein